jgi:hypothetical protein
MADEIEAPQLQHSPDLHIEVSTDPAGTRYWQYLGGVERVYPHVPVTIKHLEMIKLPEIPAEDGCWVEAEFDEQHGLIVKAPDNTPPAPPIEDAII